MIRSSSSTTNFYVNFHSLISIYQRCKIIPTAEEWFYSKYKDDPFKLLEKRLYGLSHRNLKKICKSDPALYRGFSLLDKWELVPFIMGRLKTRGIEKGKALKLIYDKKLRRYSITIVDLGDHVDFKLEDFIEG